MNILLIEDSSFLTNTIIGGLEELGCYVDLARSIADANDNWESGKDYGCIIVDLHVSPLGLKPNEVNKYFPIFGWVWIQNILKKLPPEEQKEFREKIIIHSKYIDELEKICKDKSEFKSFVRIEKEMSESETNIEILLRQVTKMLKNK